MQLGYCQIVWIQVRPNIFWVQTVRLQRKSAYDKTPLAGKELNFFYLLLFLEKLGFYWTLINIPYLM